MRLDAGPISIAERNLRQLGTAPATWCVVVAILLVHTVVELSGGPERCFAVYKVFGLTRDGFLAGKIWKIFTYGFLHGAWWHVIANALFVLLIGSRIEHVAGAKNFLKASGAGVFGGGVGHLLLSPAGANAPVLVGFSGACLSLLLLLTTLSPQSRMMPLPISGRNLGLGILLAALVLALVNPRLEIPGLSQIGLWLGQQGFSGMDRMGHACHFGGGVAGWLYGKWLLRPRVTLERLRLERWKREAVRLKRGD